MAEQPDWGSLKHTYGSAADIPGFLELLSPDPSAEVWGELWERLYHQDTVYSASFAIIPHMLEVALQWPPAGRLQPLCLAGTIVAAKEVVGARDEHMEGLSQTVAQCHNLAVETLNTKELSRQDRIYLLEAALALKGDSVWGRMLSGLVEGELQGICPNCNTYLYVVIGKDGFFVTADEWIKKLPASRTTIGPANPNELRDAGLWLHAQCIDAGDTELAGWICNAFGATTCPACGTSQTIPDIIAQYFER